MGRWCCCERCSVRYGDHCATNRLSAPESASAVEPSAATHVAAVSHGWYRSNGPPRRTAVRAYCGGWGNGAAQRARRRRRTPRCTVRRRSTQHTPNRPAWVPIGEGTVRGVGGRGVEGVAWAVGVCVWFAWMVSVRVCVVCWCTRQNKPLCRTHLAVKRGRTPQRHKGSITTRCHHHADADAERSPRVGRHRDAPGGGPWT
jgi:hypothetical protein